MQNDNEDNGGYTVFVGGEAGKELSQKYSDSYLNEPLKNYYINLVDCVYILSVWQLS